MKLFKTIGVCIAFLCVSTHVVAQQNTQHDSLQIKQVINNTFLAMETGDSVLLASCFSKDATLQVQGSKNDSVFVSIVPAKDFIARITKSPKGTLHERVVEWKHILIDNNIASVWIPYTFHRGEAYSHRGIDVFQMVRFKEGWKIVTLLYNMYQ